MTNCQKATTSGQWRWHKSAGAATQKSHHKDTKICTSKNIASDPHTAETGTADARRSTPMKPANIRVHRRASAVSNSQLRLLHSSVYRNLTGLWTW